MVKDKLFSTVDNLKLQCLLLIEGGIDMAKNGGMMSENLKTEIAKELGVYNIVKNEGWGSVSSRDCGNIVAKAIEIAERSMAGSHK